MDVSFVDYISYRNGCEYVKEAVSGTTLVDNGKTSYIQRMKNNIEMCIRDSPLSVRSRRGWEEQFQGM